jgi:hypothetical protein
MTNNEARERIAEAIHDEWLAWAKAITPELKELTHHHIPYGDYREQGNCACKTCQRIKRWETKMFKTYSELTDGVKSFDRVWANKILVIMDSLGYRQIDPKKLTVLSEEGIVKASGFITKYWNDIFTFKQCLEGMKVVAQNQLAHTIKEIKGE